MIAQFSENVLFRGLTREQLGLIIERTPISIQHFEKDEVLLRQGDPYENLFLLLKGRCISRMTDFKGRELKIERFDPGAVFAPAVLFASANDMPGSVIACSQAETAVFSKDSVLFLCSQYRQIQENFLTLLSDKFLFISKRLETMSFKTIREKLANYLLGLRQNAEGDIQLPVSVEELSAFFGVSRPSLSRVFGALEDEGILSKDQRTVRIHDIEALIRDAPDE